VPILSQTSLQIANRLEISQKEHDFYDKTITNINGEANEEARLEVATLQLEAVMDLPMVTTRGGLFIFLNAIVCNPKPATRAQLNNIVGGPTFD
jgi:mediator of RNA polymerase II transcription subunit 5